MLLQHVCLPACLPAGPPGRSGGSAERKIYPFDVASHDRRLKLFLRRSFQHCYSMDVSSIENTAFAELSHGLATAAAAYGRGVKAVPRLDYPERRKKTLLIFDHVLNRMRKDAQGAYERTSPSIRLTDWLTD